MKYTHLTGYLFFRGIGNEDFTGAERRAEVVRHKLAFDETETTLSAM